MSYWFIIGTAPPVRVFMCIHVNTRALPRILKEFDTSRTGSELHGTVSLARVIA